MLRMTKQREIILRVLKMYPGHPTADELFEQVKKKLSRISLATVYRNLEILSAAGLVTKIEISGRQKRFDSDLQQHDHVYCLECHRIDNVQLERKPGFTFKQEGHGGYVIDGYSIEFKGICPDCLKKQKKAKGEAKMGCKKCGTTDISNSQRTVLEALAQSGKACGSKDIAEASGMASKEVSSQITALKKKGFVASPARCKYEITDKGKEALA